MAHSTLVKGSLYAVLCFFSMALLGVFTKMATRDGHEIWTSVVMYITATLLMLPFMLREGVESFKTKHPFKHFFRAAIGLSATSLYLLSMQKIPIVNATLLFNSSPLFIPIMATMFLKVHVELRTWLAIALGFIGITFIIKPTLSIFDHIGDFYGLGSGIALAGAYLMVKVLTETESHNRIAFYFVFIAALIQLPFLSVAGPVLSTHDFMFAVLAGASLMVAQMSLVRAYAYAEASQVGVYQYTSVVFVGLIDWMFWGIIPAWIDLVGVVLVVIAGVIIIRSGSAAKAKSRVNS
ncbi:MAG: DMT family transporter [Chlamydiales bacterium]|nr:DMT family transporter [Chlamydiales bacterium]